MIDDDNFEILVRSMDGVFGAQEWSCEFSIYLEFFERHLQKLSPKAIDYE